MTVRTLHHYDRIGLLVPSARSESEYRLYGSEELARLREILVWRRLGVPLAEISRLLDDPAVDRRAVLEQQRELIRQRQDELDQLAVAIDRAIENETEIETGTATGTRPETADEEIRMASDQEIIEALGGFDPAEHEDEARERWGDTDAYRESAQRTKSYTPDDWRTIKAEADASFAAMVSTFEAGADPRSDEAVAHAEAFRAHVSRWFYECSPELLRSLGEMYVADPRFTATYDGADGERAGMAAWVREAWIERADRG